MISRKQINNFKMSLFPEVIIALDASDEFLKSRVMNLPESVVAGTHNTEEGKLDYCSNIMPLLW